MQIKRKNFTFTMKDLLRRTHGRSLFQVRRPQTSHTQTPYLQGDPKSPSVFGSPNDTGDIGSVEKRNKLMLTVSSRPFGCPGSPPVLLADRVLEVGFARTGRGGCLSRGRNLP